MSALTVRRPRLDAQWEYRLLYALTFPFFLAGAAVSPTRAPLARRSLFGDARARAAAVLPFAFRG